MARLQAISTAAETAEPAGVDVGGRLRAIRHLRRATPMTVAERADVSESFLSQVGRGKPSASIASLTITLEGEATFVADERTFQAGPGDVLIVPPHAAHAFTRTRARRRCVRSTST